MDRTAFSLLWTFTMTLQNDILAGGILCVSQRELKDLFVNYGHNGAIFEKMTKIWNGKEKGCASRGGPAAYDAAHSTICLKTEAVTLF